jgi:hypothetical protein
MIFPTFALASSYLYTYTGNPFTYSDDPTIWRPQTDFITVSLTLDPGPSAGSLGYTGPSSPVPFNIATGPYNISSASTSFVGSEVVLYWNSLGQITQWFINGQTNLGGLLGGQMSFSTWNTPPDPISTFAEDEVQLNIPGIITWASVAYNTNSPGTWSMSPTTPAAPVPEPTTLFLLCAGFVGLAATKRLLRI